MLTRQEFTDRLRAVNRLIHLGPPGHLRRQSTILPVVNAVGAYEADQTGANLMLLIQEIARVAAAKKIKYAVALNALLNSFPNAIYVTVNTVTFSLDPAPMSPGIGVIRSNFVPFHQVDAVLALMAINRFAPGNQLLTRLCEEVVAGHRVGIRDAVGTASDGNECQIAGGLPDDFRTPLQVALANDSPSVGNEIAYAMANLGHPPPAGFTWLETQINNMPVPNLQGLPSTTPSSAVHGPNWISAATLQAWVNGAVQFPNPLAEHRADARLVLGAVLYEGCARNGGGHTVARWNASNGIAAGQWRPPYIGLAHELIHALHNQRGEQPGNENGTLDTALYEYLCVGLGSFADYPITENALRAAAQLARRHRYG